MSSDAFTSNLNYLLPDPDLNKPSEIQKAVVFALNFTYNQQQDPKIREIIDNAVHNGLASPFLNTIRQGVIWNHSFYGDLDVRGWGYEFQQKQELYKEIRKIEQLVLHALQEPPVAKKNDDPPKPVDILPPALLFLFAIAILCILAAPSKKSYLGGQVTIDDDFAFMV